MSDADGRKKYDLGERTAKFAEAVIAFPRTVPNTPVNGPVIRQLVRAGTSVGANYCEADDAESDKGFATRWVCAGRRRVNRSTGFG